VNALRVLKGAYERHESIRLGWIGTGFEPVDSNDRCGVKSRALRVLDDDNGSAVYSFHDAY
jgi:hypothetical protein